MAPIANAPHIVGAAVTEYLVQETLNRYLMTKPNWTVRDRLVLSNRVLGGCHSLLIGLMALREVMRDHWKEDDLIHSKSAKGNKIVAVELGFLLQDTIWLLQHRKAWLIPRRVLAHHLAYGFLMVWWMRAVKAGYDKGVFFVISFLIMNLSNPPRYLSWGIKKYLPASQVKQGLLVGLHALTLSVYASTRLGLFWHLVRTYGLRKGLTTVQAFVSLPIVCRATTTSIVLVNLVQFLVLSPKWPKTKRTRSP